VLSLATLIGVGANAAFGWSRRMSPAGRPDGPGGWNTMPSRLTLPGSECRAAP